MSNIIKATLEDLERLFAAGAITEEHYYAQVEHIAIQRSIETEKTDEEARKRKEEEETRRTLQHFADEKCSIAKMRELGYLTPEEYMERIKLIDIEESNFSAKLNQSAHIALLESIQLQEATEQSAKMAAQPLRFRATGDYMPTQQQLNPVLAAAESRAKSSVRARAIDAQEKQAMREVKSSVRVGPAYSSHLRTVEDKQYKLQLEERGRRLAQSK